jgi:hypothetical protein
MEILPAMGREPGTTIQRMVAEKAVKKHPPESSPFPTFFDTKASPWQFPRHRCLFTLFSFSAPSVREALPHRAASRLVSGNIQPVAGFPQKDSRGIRFSFVRSFNTLDRALGLILSSLCMISLNCISSHGGP